MIYVPLLALVVVALIVATGRNRSADGTPPDRGALRRREVIGPLPRGSNEWRAVRALARVETRRMLWNPAVAVGVLLSVVALRFNEGSAWIIHDDVVWTQVAAFPLAGMALIAANLATLRSRRDGTGEITDPAPLSARGRTAAHLVSTLGPAALFALMLIGWLGYVSMQDPHAGRFPNPFDLALGPVLVACAGACGVLAARWLPHAAIAPVAVVVLGFVEAGLAGRGPEHNQVRWLAWFVPQPQALPVELWPRPSAIHLLYVVALGALVAVGALWRHRDTRTTYGSLAVVVAVIIATAVVQIQPISDTEGASLAAFINDPDAHQECVARSGVITCAYPGYDFSEQWRPVTEGVLARVPSAVRARGLVVRQRVPPSTIDALPPPVRSNLAPGIPRSADEPWPDDGAVHPELRWAGSGDQSTALVLGVQAGAWAVDLPAGRECHVGGRARGIIALWLGAVATKGTTAAFRDQASLPPVPEGIDPQEFEHLGALFPTVGTEPWVADFGVPYRWDRADFGYVLDLLDRPADQVEATLTAHWDHLVRPSATSDELADVFDLGRRAPTVALLSASGSTGDALDTFVDELEADNPWLDTALDQPCR